MNAFVDATLDWSQWASNASWTAWSWTQSAIAKEMTPVIGIPMAMYSEWTSSVGAKPFEEIAAGQHDDVFRGIVEAWRDQGFTKIYLRPGYEMNGTFMPWFVGYTQADADAFKAAFARIAEIAHGVAGVEAKVVWNPNMTNWSGVATEEMYPGDQYVDVVGLDIYSPQYPIDWYDVTDGNVDGSFAEWTSSAANRMGYWDYGDITQWNRDGATGSGFGLLDAIAFAKAHNKPFALPETGAGGDGSTNGPVDDGAFPTYLRDRLAEAGVTLEFANIWDATMGDGNWKFSDGSKPEQAEAWKAFATWAAGLGTDVPVSPPPPPPPPPASEITIGEGDDRLVLRVSEDAYLGDALFTIAVDGQQVGGTLTATASHAAGQSTTITVAGDWAPGAHSVTVTFLNDAYAGTAATDRNLHLDGASFNGVALVGTPLHFYSAGAKSLSFTDTTGPATPALPAPTYAEYLVGNGGANALAGADGADRLEGQAGRDTLTGGAGADIFAFARGSGHDVVADFEPGMDKLVFQGFDASQIRISSTSSGLVLRDGVSGDSVTLKGVTKLAAADVVGAPAALRGTTGNDALDRSAATGPARIGAQAGDDVLTGGAGDDWLFGHAGRDTMTGGGGGDAFVFSQGDGLDRVKDFAPGIDRLMLRDVDPATVTAAFATQDGVAGIDIGYGTAGDHVFLAGVKALLAGDLVFT
jgi:Ca2+-binding RTX toxin-like protein